MAAVLPYRSDRNLSICEICPPSPEVASLVGDPHVRPWRFAAQCTRVLVESGVERVHLATCDYGRNHLLKYSGATASRLFTRRAVVISSSDHTAIGGGSRTRLVRSSSRLLHLEVQQSLLAGPVVVRKTLSVCLCHPLFPMPHVVSLRGLMLVLTNTGFRFRFGQISLV